MAFTADDLAKIDQAIASGAVVKSMTFSDQSIEFRSMAEMKEARQLIASSIAAAAGGRGYRLASTCKGT